MSVTVSDLMKLPSLRQAKVIGGAGGMHNVVASISVLESVDPQALVNEVFPDAKFNGGELVITGFLNCLNDVDLQCANVLRLIEGGETGLVIYYVGVYLPKVDQRLIDMANAHDFVLITMPEKQRNLRYSDLITDVTECIYRDRTAAMSLVSDILARMSSAPHHQQTVSTALQMLSTELNCSVALCTHEHKILNLATWPSGIEDTLRGGIEKCSLPAGNLHAPCPFLPDATMDQLLIRSDTAQPLYLLLVKEGQPLSQVMTEQATDVTRICVNIWGREQGSIAIHELIRAILQDEPLKMRRLAEIFHIDIAAIHELWMLCGVPNLAPVEAQMPHYLNLARQCTEIVFGAVYENHPLMFLKPPKSLHEKQAVMEEILQTARKENPDAVVVCYGQLATTTNCRNAYLLVQENLEDAKRIYPKRSIFYLGELEFAAECRQQISAGEATALQLANLQIDREYPELIETVCAYLLDCGSSVTQTAQQLFLHKNTIKYRLQRVSDLLGYRPDKMPECMNLYRSAAIYRLLNH
jgi:hypothetical protein